MPGKSKNAVAALAAVLAIGAAVAAIPALVSDFVLLQIVIRSLWLGIVGASLAFLIGQAGLISLSQTAIFGTSGYMMAILVLDHGWNTWLAVVAAVAVGPVAGLVVGVVSRRSSDLYLMMLTLSIGVFAFFFAQQYQPLTRGHTGFNGFRAPHFFGADLGEREPLYYFTAIAAVLVVAVLHYVMRGPAGLAYRGLRDNRRRLQALGYSPEATTISAFTVAGFAAGIGGVISVWYNGAISPGSIDLTRIIELLIVVTIGGALRIEGAFLGALAVTLLRNYASDLTNRVDSLVGVVFILIVLFSKHGLVGVVLGMRTQARRVLGVIRGRRAPSDGRGDGPHASVA